MTLFVDAALEKEKIQSCLHDKALAIVSDNISIYETIDSTNLEAKRLLKDCTTSLHGTLILAEHQSAGRGRLGRSFYSPQRRGIYVSFIYGGNEYAVEQNSDVSITVAAAVAVRRALECFGVNAKIKWVNDLYVEGKKVCGILTEGIFSSSKETLAPKVEAYIVGIGLNVFESAEGFPEDIKNIAGSINKDIGRNELVASIVNSLVDVLALDTLSILEEYRHHSLVLNKMVTVIKPTATYNAKVLEITDKAHLLVQLDDGSTEELLSGEISIRL